MSDHKGKDRTIFWMAFRSLLLVLTVEMLLLAGSLVVGGVIQTLNKNAQDILAKQVENRGSYLANDMAINWSNLSMISDKVDDCLQEILDSSKMTPEEFVEAGESASLINGVFQDMIDTMYSKQVSGIFMLINTQSLDEEAAGTMQGIYLRDLDPTSMPSDLHADILVERAPVAVVRAGYLATDTSWQPVFSAADSIEQPFFYKPFQAAVEGKGKLSAEACGYWTTQPYSLSGDNREAIAYSQPLILPDGTVYGVIGVEILSDYLRALLPSSELLERNWGSYMLACSTEDGTLTPVIMSSEVLSKRKLDELQFLFLDQNKDVAVDPKNEYYGAVRSLVLYSRNAPFDSDKWYLVGFAQEDDLYAFAIQVERTLMASFVGTILIGLIGIFLVSYRLSKPIHMLSGEVEKAKQTGEQLALPSTGIREIDQFSNAITDMQQEVADSATRFMQIIRMSSVDLAGYELREGSDRVYVTANYFPLMGAENVDIDNLTVDKFRDIKTEIKKNLTSRAAEDGSTIYAMQKEDGGVKYLRSSTTQDGNRLVGLLEDVTASTLEKKQIERERDSDILTKLYGRQGFRREAEELFAQPDVMKHAALLMIDLDNLKTTNDRFGHNFGDLYIQTAARCFQENTPAGTLCARMGGDEFQILFYGFDDRETIRECLDKLYRAIAEVEFVLPDGQNMGLSASGGFAWYPEDGDNLSALMKYSDFAMYQVKRTKKGQLKEFDSEAWQQQMSEDQSRLEFHQMLDARKIAYHFQPIFRADDGGVYGYEALMRVDMPSLREPKMVLQIAKEEGLMKEIERLTMFVATDSYMALLDKGAVSKTAFLFINSIANEALSPEDEKEYHERFAEIQDRVIIEITETENLEMELIRKKGAAEGFTGIFALDDYGTGYNSELNLLTLNPHYVKVDVTIVRDIDANENKQQIVRNIVQYAHERDMKIIAEGIETGAEMKKLLELNVDLLQGYYLARPGAVPPALSEDARLLLWDQRKSGESQE
ncbi:MAG: EAL domain-containing protein [Lachnospiraceae bacterium]|nr:EAL domain-containing protein [Lachnospiraceae bacterium]